MAFIRVGDALNDIAVVQRWADWLKPHLTKDSIVVGDTWTILPLLQELATARGALGSLAPVVTFPAYPTLSAFEQVLLNLLPLLSNAEHPQVLFILSVISTKAFLDRIQQHAPRVLGAGTEVLLLPLVDTRPVVDEWQSFVRVPGIQRYNLHRGEPCALCLDSRKKPLITIDAKKYAPVVEGTLKPQMLRAESASSHREFWQYASETDSVRVHVEDFSTGERRHLPISIDVSRLLTNEQFRRKVIGKLRMHTPICDLVVLPRHSATDALVGLAETAYRKPDVFVLPRALDDQHRSSEGSELANAEEALEQMFLENQYEHVLILDDAVINGRTLRSIHRLLQRVLTNVREKEQNTRDYVIHGFVIVGRPATERRWKRLIDSLRQGTTGVRLAAAETLYMPDASATCPWCVEVRVLQSIIRDLTRTPMEDLEQYLALSSIKIQEVLQTFRLRLDHLLPQLPENERVLSTSLYLCRSSGSMDVAGTERLSPHSLFGEHLSEPAAYAAVATAMQEIRQARVREVGVSYVWDVPKVLTAYHDPLLSAAFLRATLDEEIVVLGSDPEFEDALAEISFASVHPEFRQSPLLAAELEWALVTEKLPLEHADRIRDKVIPIFEHVGPPLSTALQVARVLRSTGV